ncbi:hypothetical protein [Brachybacterium sp. AOP3-A1-3]|uniref:hypothetical protein n=1 Tax=Brachybacterium sp. AOP3-A1-3 TaxID=3457699 RepID=UPI0040339A5F
MQAPDLGQAQRLADQGQSQIDAASEVVAKHARMVEATRAYEDAATPDLLERSINALTLSFPGLDLRSLDRLGAREAERLIGIPAEVGLGAHFLILDSVSSAHFDPERFHTLLRETSRLCSDDSRLSVVASQSSALEGLATSSRLVYEAWEVFESTLLRIRDDDTLMRRTIKFYGDFYEDVAGAFLAWYNLVAGIKEKPYAKLIQLDTTELARSLSRQERTAFLLQDDGASLRNASQHGNSFTLDGDEVIFKLRSYDGTLSRAEVIDRIFSFVESILAMSWSLRNALARLDIEVPLKANDAAYMNLTPFRLATLWLESDSSNLVDAKETATTWEFTMAIDQREVAPMALTFAQKLPEDVAAVSVRTPSSHTSLIVPFAAYERFHAAHDAALEPVHQVMALVVFRSECMVNGKAIVTPSDLMYTVATIGLPLLQKDDLSLIPLLRRVYSLTISYSVPDITRVVKGVFEVTRAPGAVRRLKLEATLTDWMNGPAPTFPAFQAVTVSK